MHEFILSYVLPGLLVWLVSFRVSLFERDIGIIGTFAVFCVSWPIGFLLLLVYVLVVIISTGEYTFDRVNKFLMTDIFKRKDND